MASNGFELEFNKLRFRNPVGVGSGPFKDGDNIFRIENTNNPQDVIYDIKCDNWDGNDNCLLEDSSRPFDVATPLYLFELLDAVFRRGS